MLRLNPGVFLPQPPYCWACRPKSQYQEWHVVVHVYVLFKGSRPVSSGERTLNKDLLMMKMPITADIHLAITICQTLFKTPFLFFLFKCSKNKDTLERVFLEYVMAILEY